MCAKLNSCSLPFTLISIPWAFWLIFRLCAKSYGIERELLILSNRRHVVEIYIIIFFISFVLHFWFYFRSVSLSLSHTLSLALSFRSHLQNIFQHYISSLHWCPTHHIPSAFTPASFVRFDVIYSKFYYVPVVPAFVFRAVYLVNCISNVLFQWILGLASFSHSDDREHFFTCFKLM